MPTQQSYCHLWVDGAAMSTLKKEEAEAQNDAAACPGTEIIRQTMEAALEPTT